MNLIIKLAFISSLVFSLIFASWYIINGDIVFSADIARDFHLLRELDEKKLVLIGPRSSTGLFHGPLWTYINYPMFVLGQGNPVILAWGWLIFGVIFVISNYFIAKDLFNKNAAMIFAFMSALFTAYHTKGMYNPDGAMMIIPSFFYTFVKFVQTKKIIFLISNFIIGGVLIQFQMALGIPFIILTLLYSSYSIIKSKKYKYFTVFLAIPLMLSNFILFDLRHENILSQKVIGFILPTTQEGTSFNYIPLIFDRIHIMFTGIELLRRDPYGYINLILLLITLVLIFIQIKTGRYKAVYFSFIYFYVGFFALSFINKGPILYFYLFPLFPLVYLIFSSLIDSKFKKLFFVFFLILAFFNIQNALQDIKFSTNIIGKNIYSWKFLNDASSKMFMENENELGYFIYSPDIFAYEGKYAAIYNAEKSNKNTYYFEKKPVTYLLVAPPPPNNPHMKDDFWKETQLNLRASPSSILSFSNGYKLEKYILTEIEINEEFDPSIDPGLHFR